MPSSLLGTSQISLIWCYCGGEIPNVEQMQEWYQHWVEDFSAGPAVPVV